MMARSANNLVLLHRDRGYRHSEPVSLLYQVRIAINDANLSSYAIQDLVEEHSGVYMKTRTIDNLMNGQTTKPRLETVERIMTALGYHMRWSR